MRWARGIAVATACALVAGGLAWVAGGAAATVGGLPATVIVATWAVVLNLAAWVPASVWRTERFYDAVGSATFLSTTALAFVLGGGGWRAGLLVLAVWVWAVRLGTFLVRRIRKDGHDGRFDDLKTHPGTFLIPWSLQALWAVVTALPVVVAASPVDPGSLGPITAVGLGVWALGFGVEVAADAQKSTFRADPANAGRFVRSGLWAWSRHPNYLGEIVLWAGLTIAAAEGLAGGQWVAVLSPVFVAWLLTRVSGIPLLEARAEARWGDDPDYRAYVARTPVLVPGWPRRG